MRKQANVSALLAKYAGYSSNYGAGNADHLPMATVALAEMGASLSRIESWAEHYATTLKLPLAAAEEREQREFWYQRISVQGREAVLAATLPHLADGIGASGFHSAIRAGYAIDQNDDRELASALESWQREYLDLPAPANIHVTSLDEALKGLARSTIRVEPRGLIAPRMLTVANDPGFAAIAKTVPSSADIDDLAVAAAAAFAESGDFTALHVMTGTFALRSLSTFLIDPEAAMPGFWRAYAAAALVSGAIPSLAPARLSALRTGAPRGWEQLLLDAAAHEDEHVIKATYTAWRLDEALREPIFRAAARRYIDQETYR
jgi:hypothetical protein